MIQLVGKPPSENRRFSVRDGAHVKILKAGKAQRRLFVRIVPSFGGTEAYLPYREARCIAQDAMHYLQKNPDVHARQLVQWLRVRHRDRVTAEKRPIRRRNMLSDRLFP